MRSIGCTGLTSVTIPNSVTSIGYRAFYDCSSLDEVYFQGDAPTLVGAVFAGSPAMIYYLAGTAGWDRLYGNRPTIRMGPPELNVQVYAGLSITGTVGTIYSIDYVTDLAQTNAPTAWRCIEYLQLPASPYLWADKSAPATGQRFYRAVAMAAPTNLVFIPPGTFMMGSPTNEVDRDDREGPRTAVTISRGFWMGEYEVTQGEYLAVMGSNPSRFNGVQLLWDDSCQCSTNKDFGTDLSRPVEQVSWGDASAYCARLTEREVAAGRIGTNSGYRLPTEAEWEYACRGWTSTRFSYGDDPDYTNLTNYAWYGDNSDGQTHAVGQKLPNPWGLHDMHGNVWEWCQDWWSDRLPGGLAVDPRGPGTGSDRVFRGGGWSYWYGWYDARYCRSARRGSSNPGNRFIHIGFRVVLAPGQP
jgi:formylglycine-generating enzyme required for sulfatase activity